MKEEREAEEKAKSDADEERNRNQAEEDDDDGGEWVEGAGGDSGDGEDDEDDEDGPSDSDEMSIATDEVNELAAEIEEWENGSSDHSDDDNESHYDSNAGDLNDDFDDGMSGCSELSLPEEYDFHRDCRDETSSMFSYYEKHAYDPDKVTKEGVQWTDRCRVLGLNTDLDEEKKAFISGRGRYDDLYDFRIKKAGLDPKDNGHSEHSVFHAYEPNEPGEEQQIPTFPFHEECYKLLARRLGHRNRKDIDKDILYEVMAQLTEPWPRVLALDYGNFDGAEQFWECHAGEEWVIQDPGPRPGIEEEIKSMLPASLFDRPVEQPLNLAHKVRRDSLAVLPYDVLYGIFAHLSIKDTKSLVNASWHVFDATREPQFWRHMIRLHIVPFFYELEDMLKDTTFPDTFDWRGAFQWLNEITKPKFGMDGPLMAIANRRRIWEACSQLAPLYHEKLYAEAYRDSPAEEAAAIMAIARVYHHVVTIFPQPPVNELTTKTTQFIRSWSEIGHRACDFETYWTGAYGDLVGISVDFGSGLRVFGSTNGVKGQSLRIPSGAWIQEIRLRIRDVSLWISGGTDHITGPEDPRALGASSINGMQVFLTDGTDKNIKVAGRDQNHRSLQILEGLCMVGITGEITADGKISSIALLQAANSTTSSKPTTNPAPTYHPSQTNLWTPRGTHVYSHSGLTHPIWSNPTKSLYTFPPPLSSSQPAFPHPDLIPHHIICWSQQPSSYTSLRQICFLQIPDEHGTSVIGIWQKTNHKYGSAEHIGAGGPVHAMLGDEWIHNGDEKNGKLDLYEKAKYWEKRFMTYFDIDGAAGEVVSEVHVTRDRRCIRLITNRGREGIFGDTISGSNGGDNLDPGHREWDVKKAEEGEVIVGLSACFGRLGGWSPTAKRWSHWGLSDLGVLVAREGVVDPADKGDGAKVWMKGFK
ncbi:hypothetical protein FB567DRAFT_588761 [Paraphoma chrysanthemicola]|uniref:F-box domain-containing protein n=1 Tax=Paraphoma chrysanthemicola TaxID=798071 RepID=A0A8K0RE70_9PLEO|nr:hypothetical protein FB567DRAFT_588761 [Paraphoma chrysanthemicola]